MPALAGLLTTTVLAALTLAGCASSARAARPADSPSPSVTASGSPAAPGSASATRKATAVTIGDSIMAGYGLDDGDDWPSLMAQDRGQTIVNLSCSGAGFIVTGSCGTDFEGLISAAVAHDPDVVIVQGSDNDQNESTADIGAATTKTIQELHAELPNARIVGLSTLWDPSSPAPAQIAASSAAVKQAVTAAGGVYLDIGQPLSGRSDLLQDDDEHPTVAGERVLQAVVDQALSDAGIDL